MPSTLIIAALVFLSALALPAWSQSATAVNTRTAKALGIVIPPTVMLRADRVIE